MNWFVYLENKELNERFIILFFLQIRLKVFYYLCFHFYFFFADCKSILLLMCGNSTIRHTNYSVCVFGIDVQNTR